MCQIQKFLAKCYNKRTMDIENPNKTKTERGKEALIALEKEGAYVFHGSTELIEELEPRQAKIWDKNKKKMVKHGEPSVVNVYQLYNFRT